MKIMFAMSLFAGLLMASMANAATVWNPLGNTEQTEGPYDWGNPLNWTKGVPTANPDPDIVDPPSSGKAVFNVFDVGEAEVTDAQEPWKLSMGDNGSGGVVRVKDGGSLTTGDTWSAVGYNDEARLIIETGGSATFGEHLWVGLFEGLGFDTPTVDVDGGTLTVNNVLGLNWEVDWHWRRLCRECHQQWRGERAGPARPWQTRGASGRSTLTLAVLSMPPT